MRLELGRGPRYFGLMFLGIFLFLFFSLPYWYIFEPSGVIEGVLGLFLAITGIFMTIAGFILVMEIIIESRFRERDRKRYPYTPRETYFDEN